MAKRTMKTAFRSPNTAVDPQRSAALKGNKNAKKRSAVVPAFITGLIHDPKFNEDAVKKYEKYGKASVKSYKIASKLRKVARLGN
jgi:hypothetical protein